MILHNIIVFCRFMKISIDTIEPTTTTVATTEEKETTVANGTSFWKATTDGKITVSVPIPNWLGIPPPPPPPHPYKVTMHESQ